MHSKIDQAVKVLREGGVIAYPTEGVFGLGCDPFNETAVLRLLKIKRRSVKNGLILIASSLRQLEPLVKIDLCRCNKIKKKRPITWIFPATKKAPSWITGKFDSVAIRVTLHPVAKILCQKFEGPIVSTSANLAGEPPTRNRWQIYKNFVSLVDFIVPGRVGSLKKPTEIRDVRTGKILRA